MEIRTLKYILSLAEQGSFTAAAKTHFVTQPAVSIALKKLERELGHQLYRFEGRSIVFTPAGEILLDYARRIVDLEGELLRRMSDLEGLRKGKVTVGTIDAASIYVLPDVFSRFHDIYPGIEIKLEISSTVPLVEKLKAGELDLVVGTIPVKQAEGLDIIPIYGEPLLVIAPASHPLAGGSAVGPESLSGQSFIFFHEGSVTRAIVERAFEEGGISPLITMAIDSPEVIKNLVYSGLGMSVLPERIVRDDLEKGDIVALRVEGLHLERHLGLILQPGRYRSVTVQAFLDVLAEEMKLEFPADLEQTEASSRSIHRSDI
jgi:DNA-binding transcriptional LysR family regulator